MGRLNLKTQAMNALPPFIKAKILENFYMEVGDNPSRERDFVSICLNLLTSQVHLHSSREREGKEENKGKPAQE